MSSKKKVYKDDDVTRVMLDLKSVPFHLAEVAPQNCADWLQIFATSCDTQPEMLLSCILPAVATLMGSTRIGTSTRVVPEDVNLFTITLCETGGGKKPAFDHGCGEPLRFVEQKHGVNLLIDDMTEAGVFQSLINADGNKALIGKEEADSWLEELCGRQKEGRLPLSRIKQCFDGSPWSYSTSSSRLVIDRPGISIAALTQCQPFLSILEKITASHDGFLDRLFICHGRPQRDEEERQAAKQNLERSPVPNLRIVYDAIYTSAHQEDSIILNMGEETKELTSTTNKMVNQELNRHWAACTPYASVIAKYERLILRVAGVMEYFYHFLEAKLNEQQVLNNPPAFVKKTTVEYAIRLIRFYEEEKRILTEFIKTGNDQKRERNVYYTVLSSPGPVVTVRMATLQFPGSSRPKANQISNIFETLSADGVGKDITVGRARVFFKKPPGNLSEDDLEIANMGLEEYTDLYNTAALKNITAEQQTALLGESPYRNIDNPGNEIEDIVVEPENEENGDDDITGNIGARSVPFLPL